MLGFESKTGILIVGHAAFADAAAVQIISGVQLQTRVRL